MGVRRAAVAVAFAAGLSAATTLSAQELGFGGFVQLDRRLYVSGDSAQLADFYNVLRPELVATFEDRVDVVASLDLRFYDFSGVHFSDELSDASRHFPNSLTVWEANVRIAALFVESLDLTVGKQRVQWGTADGFNPTDRLNAYDLSDLTNFTSRIPTWAVRSEYYMGETLIDAVWAPTGHAPLMPDGPSGLIAGGPSFALEGAPLEWESHFVPPPRSPGYGQVGLRLSGQAGGADLSISAFDGFDGVPVPERLRIVDGEVGEVSGQPLGHAWSTLPRIRVLGADFVTEWRGAGVWGEGGVVWPEAVDLVALTVAGGDSIRERSASLTSDPYATWTVGGDYTFPGGWYMNLQWAHGIFLERGRDSLHDYLVGQLERGFLRESVQVSLKGIAEVAQWTDWTEHLGFGLLPELVYAPVDNVDLSVGAFLLGGSRTSLLGQWSVADQVYMRAKATF